MQPDSIRRVIGEVDRGASIDWPREPEHCVGVALGIVAGQAGRFDRVGADCTAARAALPGEQGEPAWPPLAMFKALLLAVRHDLSEVRLVEALEDRASFRRFYGFSGTGRRRSAPRLCGSAGR